MPATLSHYQQRIAELVPEHDPRHIEAWMRVEHPTLDHLSPDRFAAEVRTAAACISEAGVEESESLATSYGL